MVPMIAFGAQVSVWNDPKKFLLKPNHRSHQKQNAKRENPYPTPDMELSFSSLVDCFPPMPFDSLQI
jgi:hypothetical protein